MTGKVEDSGVMSRLNIETPPHVTPPEDSNCFNKSDSNRNIDSDVNEMMAIELQYGKDKYDTIRVKFDDKPEDLAMVRRSHRFHSWHT
jgi:hypothetical protein